MTAVGLLLLYFGTLALAPQDSAYAELDPTEKEAVDLILEYGCRISQFHATRYGVLKSPICFHCAWQRARKLRNLSSLVKGYQAFFYCKSKGNKAVITSNNALKSSESQLSNAGSTIKIGHFFVDIKRFKIKVPNPEISEVLKKSKFASTKLNFRKQINEYSLNYLQNGSKTQAHQVCMTQFQFICGLFFHQILYQVPPQHLKSHLCNFKHFVVQKEKNLEFCLNCLWGVPAN